MGKINNIAGILPKPVKRVVNRLATYLYYKIKYRGKLSFTVTSEIVKGSYFEGANRLGKETYFYGNMGYGTYIGYGTQLQANIGRFTSIGPGVECNHGFHPYTAPFATTSPFFYSKAKRDTFATENLINDKKKRIEIGNDCWVGQNVFFSGGVVIGDGAVIFAGAYVVKDIPPYAIAGGVPAKVIKYRYDDETIRMLLEIKWWNQPICWLKGNWRLMSDVDSLVKYYYQHREEFPIEGIRHE